MSQYLSINRNNLISVVNNSNLLNIIDQQLKKWVNEMAQHYVDEEHYRILCLYVDPGDGKYKEYGTSTHSGKFNTEKTNISLNKVKEPTTQIKRYFSETIKKHKNFDDFLKNNFEIKGIYYTLCKIGWENRSNIIVLCIDTKTEQPILPYKITYDFILEHLQGIIIKPETLIESPSNARINFHYSNEAYKEIENTILKEWKSQISPTTLEASPEILTVEPLHFGVRSTSYQKGSIDSTWQLIGHSLSLYNIGCFINSKDALSISIRLNEKINKLKQTTIKINLGDPSLSYGISYNKKKNLYFIYTIKIEEEKKSDETIEIERDLHPHNMDNAEIIRFSKEPESVITNITYTPGDFEDNIQLTICLKDKFWFIHSGRFFKPIKTSTSESHPYRLATIKKTLSGAPRLYNLTPYKNDNPVLNPFSAKKPVIFIQNLPPELTFTLIGATKSRREIDNYLGLKDVLSKTKTIEKVLYFILGGIIYQIRKYDAPKQSDNSNKNKDKDKDKNKNKNKSKSQGVPYYKVSHYLLFRETLPTESGFTFNTLPILRKSNYPNFSNELIKNSSNEALNKTSLKRENPQDAFLDISQINTRFTIHPWMYNPFLKQLMGNLETNNYVILSKSGQKFAAITYSPKAPAPYSAWPIKPDDKPTGEKETQTKKN